MRQFLAVLLLLIANQAYALRLPNGQLLSSGDELSKVYENLGKPIMKYKAKTRCGSGGICSVTRMVYRFDGRKWFIDMRSGQIMNIEWTYR
ncbi:hypothetical protein [Neptunomonas antarctica]|uniref:DUF2845 domain-containing protein n=1 Tax=Neptunomonas antarctica TaxID=619304 RepID=A0A1N7M638_9GAMM|nr:hypothetical protein [Neptunomonas antarctica]SIS81493.1 hypothetical protein SAMN05421760_105197 [Neptunomonas antarctica]